MMDDPCKNCKVRKWYAKRMGIHFWGEECFYECDEYEKYKKEKGEMPNDQDGV